MKQQISFQGIDAWELRCGHDVVHIAPQYGGRLLEWRTGRRRIIPWTTKTKWQEVNKVRGGNPILFPFIARHYVDGVLGRWRDQNTVVREMPMHGFARQSAFTVVEDGRDDALRMRLTSTPETLTSYPFPFTFEVAYRLGPEPGLLEAEFLIVNTGSVPLPYYAGHHFYFSISHKDRADWTLDLPFARTAIQQANGELLFGPPPEPSTLLSAPQIIDRFHIEPQATRFSLRHKTGRTLEFDLAPRETIPWYAVTTWTQTPSSDFFCVEPWLGLPNAIHHSHGLRLVLPGKSERAVCALRYHEGYTKSP